MFACVYDCVYGRVDSCSSAEVGRPMITMTGPSLLDKLHTGVAHLNIENRCIYCLGQVGAL